MGKIYGMWLLLADQKATSVLRGLSNCGQCILVGNFQLWAIQKRRVIVTNGKKRARQNGIYKP